MNFWKSAGGILEIELTGADLPASFRCLTAAGIPLSHVENRDLLTARFQIPRSACRLLKRLSEKRGDRVRILNTRGLYWTARRFITRPVLVLGLAAILALFLFLPTRVLFLRVEGNRQVPSDRIREAAAQCGIRFFMPRRMIRSEQLKNALLQKLPELKWAGINTRGCVAVLSVRERERTAPQKKELRIASVVAACDGVISSCTAQRGNLLCRPGQAVARDQVLISGYMDNGLKIRATEAKGEIYARTVRRLTAVTPELSLRRGQPEKIHRSCSLILGKKRIKLFGDSGNYPPGCGRMYAEYYITLPGGYVLPAALAVDTVESCQLTEEKKDPEQSRKALSAFAARCLRTQMIAGSILSQQQQFFSQNGFYGLKGEYLCHEMIGRVRQEKIGE